ncbi:10330_t:CDS:2 [Scutellospora calospora]|uniref:10330_t:CDS:1 n=1 Tax=Scutellospora calospora TaxID=85575 RepID=A0ACA9KC04_9GLOM|nr:10330_t:CDS:2 [Scutellospora calospora]
MATSSTKVVELGFAEPPENPLTADNFPSKIGGKPAWLNPGHILSADQVLCGICKKQMILLVQLYTPEDHPPDAFHRTIYVFCCKNGTCHKASWRKRFLKVFRSQLPKYNPYWPPSNEETNNCNSNGENSNGQVNRLLKKFISVDTCVVCGLLGSKKCGKCHKTYYCSKEHQIIHWTSGQHKLFCNTTTSPSEDHDSLCRQLCLFPEFEIVSEAEGNLDKDDENDESEGGLALVPVGDEIYENTKVNVDKAFLKFQKKVEPYPDQVLRYARLDYENEKNATPLWVSDIGKPMPEDIPSCSHCGQERTFEFQILSILLNYLQVDHTQKDSLDWGTLLVYSCKDNCHIGDKNYVEEILWRQDFSDEGVNWCKLRS